MTNKLKETIFTFTNGVLITTLGFIFLLYLESISILTFNTILFILLTLLIINIIVYSFYILTYSETYFRICKVENKIVYEREINGQHTCFQITSTSFRNIIEDIVNGNDNSFFYIDGIKSTKSNFIGNCLQSIL